MIAAYHDLSVAKNGNIFVVTDEIRRTEVDGEPILFQDNYIAVVTGDGHIMRRISLFDAFRDNPWGQEIKQKLSASKQPDFKTRFRNLG